MEEEVLFPAFETRTGNTMGPTYVMRTEHEQIRALLQVMARAALESDHTAISACRKRSTCCCSSTI